MWTTYYQPKWLVTTFTKKLKAKLRVLVLLAALKVYEITLESPTGK